MIYINGKFTNYNLTGVQRYSYEIINELLGIYTDDIQILIPPNKVNPVFNTSGFPFKKVGSLKNALWQQIDLPLFLKRNANPLLLNLANTAPAFYKNQIVTIHDLTTFVHPAWFRKSFVVYYKSLIPAICRVAKKIITVSENSKNDIEKILKIPGSKIDVIYPAVANIFYANSTPSEKILGKYSLEKNGFILAVSSLDPRKNFKRLIEAYNEAKIKLPLIIVGTKGKAFADVGLKTNINNQSEILFLDYVSDEELLCLYKNAICFVYPSLYEGFGIPPLEAMTCGCPTIVSNTSSLPEVCGKASIYVNPLSTDSIKEAMLLLINNESLRNELIALGFMQGKKFSWKQSALQLNTTIKELM